MGPVRAALPALALLAVFGVALSGDVALAARRFQEPVPESTWVQAFQQQEPQPTDLIITDSPTKVRFYFGRDDFYIRPQDYERYAYQASDTVRSIYTDAVLLRQPGDFDRLVESPNPGRTVWVLGPREPILRLAQRIDPDLWPSLVRLADRMIRTVEDWVLLKVTLPRRAGSA